MQQQVRDAVASALGSSVASTSPTSGGDINDAYRVVLEDGRHIFVKTHERAPAGMFEAEARGLGWLAETRALRVPQVLACSESPPLLALELVEPARKASDHDEQLGRGLAALHRAGAPCFGLDHDNFIGRLPQHNEPRRDWPAFYAECRLQPQLRLAAERGLASVSLRKDFDRLFTRLDGLVGDPEPPARLHGDLWGGNLLTDERGAPCLIDPAVYGGHREVDLAMMQLFGGFSSRCFDAYREAYPLSPEHHERIALYQLYPLLVHVNLFGSGYVGSVRRALARYV